MKTKITLFMAALFINFAVNAQYQKSIIESSRHFHDLNIVPLTDGSSDYVVAGNLFNASLSSGLLMLQRIDNLGNVVWINQYTHSTFQNLRIFDAVAYESLVVITGSVDVAGSRHVFISKIHATTGLMIDAKYYEIVSANFNSVGLHIEATETDATGNGLGDVGFIVSGFFSDCYNVNVNCNNNIGFVLRTDFGLNELWTIEIDTNLSTNTDDFDFANGITETDNGYLITGSCTAQLALGGEQQAVLAHKIDFLGAVQWDQSYYFGNNRDISVDAYYDSAADELFMLTNYSFSHYFGITVLDDSVPGAGSIDLSRSWYAFEWNDLNRYGFTVMESVADANNLVISGYDRDESWVDGNNNPQFGNSNVFVYEFNKTTGSQVGPLYQYTVPHVEPTGDDYNFWFWQMPLMYYPDISYQINDPANVNSAYYHLGYRTMGTGTTQSEMFRTTSAKINNCDYIDRTINSAGINPISVPVISGFVPNTDFTTTINNAPVTITENFCESTLGIGDAGYEQPGIYPNPASSQIFVSGGEFTHFTIISSLGAIVKEGKLKSDSSIAIEDLSSGVYVIYLLGENGELFAHKFIKNQ